MLLQPQSSSLHTSPYNLGNTIHDRKAAGKPPLQQLVHSRWSMSLAMSLGPSPKLHHPASRVSSVAANVQTCAWAKTGRTATAHQGHHLPPWRRRREGFLAKARRLPEASFQPPQQQWSRKMPSSPSLPQGLPSRRRPSPDWISLTQHASRTSRQPRATISRHQRLVAPPARARSLPPLLWKAAPTLPALARGPAFPLARWSQLRQTRRRGESPPQRQGGKECRGTPCAAAANDCRRPGRP
mmetsp:Transcript_62916/g.149936  ORF Transcript_62916/g.149936 Transcript_62916/m.149936 type:complete len:241 (-) Transcript_62916:57-779(-)